jgi:pyrimidine deaminase RibD-like protein
MLTKSQQKRTLCASQAATERWLRSGHPQKAVLIGRDKERTRRMITPKRCAATHVKGTRMRVCSAILTALPVLTVAAVGAPGAVAQDFSFVTSKQFVTTCDGAGPSEECLNALLHVELVVNSTDDPNNTCDGGTDALLNAGSNVELNSLLAERVMKVVAWLKQHTEYDSLSYGDGIWSGLKGVYCR